MALYRETVRDILIKLRRYASIAVDLSLYSIAFNDKTAAMETLRLEDRIDHYYRDLLAKTSIAIRSPDQAKLALGIYEVAHSLDIISDSAGDLASIVIMEYPVHEYIRAVANCCGELVVLVKSHKSLRELPSMVDILLIKRGDSYILAPSRARVEDGDSIVVRGSVDAVLEVANLLGDDSIMRIIDEVKPTITMGWVGDDLASSLLRLKSLTRQMLDLAFHALIYNDESLAKIVADMEDTVDQVYYEALYHTYSASTPQSAREMVSLSIFIKSLEAIGDAAARLSLSVLRGYNSSLIEEVLEEQEEVYLKLRATSKASGRKLSSLNLEDLGLITVALGRDGSWIIPVDPEHSIYEGDIILVKYYKPERLDSEKSLISKIKSLGLEPFEEEE
ncbi:MAG: hypothetical protein GSR85_09545 [Desulfurococcales archaeon]|nr:hypothetical protein [Desulfurococcales archaeon]